MNGQAGFTDLDAPFRIGDCEVDPRTGRVRNGDGAVTLQPQAIKVLTYLAGRPGEVVGRAEIEEAVWADRIVGYDALTTIIFKLRKALGDDPRQPRIIETLSKRGYRLLEVPRPLDAPEDEQLPEMATEPPTPPRLSRRRAGLFAGLLAVAAVAAGSFWFAGSFDTSETEVATSAPRRAIVVLPFEALGPLNGREHLPDGLTDDLTTALAKTRNLLVIARDSAFVYKEGSPHYREIAERLKVDYILRGTVRSTGDDLRINVQLVDATDGSHLWAETFDSTDGDIFKIEDRVVRAVVPALTGQAVAAGPESSLIVRTSSTRAYKAFQLGRQHFHLYLNRPENAKARALFEEALAHDPNFAMARAMLAWTYIFEAANGWAENRDEALRRADEQATLAIAEDPGIPLAYFITGLVYRERGDYVKAMVEAEKAISLDPNYANGHVLVATLFYYAGRPAESVERLKRAMRLNPHHPFNYHFHLGQAYFVMRDYDRAIDAFLAGIETNPAAERLHVWLAASYAQAGRAADASWEAEQVLALNPEFSLSAIADVFPFKDAKDRDHLLDALRKAGFS